MVGNELRAGTCRWRSSDTLPEDAGEAERETEDAAWRARQDDDLVETLDALLAGERDLIANAANVAALLFERLAEVNWAGFYFLRGDDLVLGPFQGRVACVRIPLGRGVCGTAGARRETIVVPDVHDFPGHIACDAASRSEIVVPLLRDGVLLGVLDIDSPRPDRFRVADRLLCEQVAQRLVQACTPGT